MKMRDMRMIKPDFKDLETGDIITIRKGEPGTLGFSQTVVKVGDDNENDGISPTSLYYMLEYEGWELLEATRKVADIIPEKGNVVFTDEGIMLCTSLTDDTEEHEVWVSTDATYFAPQSLPGPVVPAVVVPIHEWNKLAEALEDIKHPEDEWVYNVANAAKNLVDEAERQWERVGLNYND